MIFLCKDVAKASLYLESVPANIAPTFVAAENNDAVLEEMILK